MSIDSYIDDAYPDFVSYKTNIVNMVNLSIDAYSPGSKGERKSTYFHCRSNGGRAGNGEGYPSGISDV